MSNKFAWVWTILAVLVASYFITNCCYSTEPEEPEGIKENPSFSQDIQPVFNTSCSLSGCHDSTASSGLNLIEGQAYANLVNIPSTEDPDRARVIPNNAQDSFLVIKIEGRQDVGSRMPLGGDPLSTSQIQNVKNWINTGARDN